MEIVRSSMEEDIKRAREGRLAPEPTAGVGESAAIPDECEGNRSYDDLKRGAAEAPAGEAAKARVPGLADELREEKGKLEALGKEKLRGWMGKHRLDEKKLTAIVIITAIVLVLAMNLVGRYAWKEEEAPAFVNQYVADVSQIANAADARRVKNLSIIAEAAAVYHLSEKADLPVSASYIKLDEENEVTPYLGAALRFVGRDPNLLLDEREPAFFYTYRSSDGQNFELGARMEDTSSINCDNQDPCLWHQVLDADAMAAIGLDLDRYKQSLADL